MMISPAFSVIIPAYMAAEYIGSAIQSVLDQTFSDFEIVVVNDASPDETSSVIQGFSDPRIKYIVHDANKGLPATRNTGIRASSGKYVAFLDHDDVFLPEKLNTHYSFLEQHPEVGAAYNSRFEVGQSIEEIHSLWIAPAKAELSDLVLGYPFSPSDLVVRREWLLEIGLLDEGNSFHGEDLNTNCRLALAGCKFAPIGRALNFRRNHPARFRKNLDASLENVFRNLEIVFTDPRCPKEVIGLRSLAYANNYLVWSFWALAQNETELGMSYLRNAVQMNPEILRSGARKLMDFLVFNCAYDDRGPLAESVKTVFQQFPKEMEVISQQSGQVLARATLLRAIQDVIWGRWQQGKARFAEITQMKVAADLPYMQMVNYQLLGYKKEYGTEAVLKVLAILSPFLNRLSRGCGEKMTSLLLINLAFEDYQAGAYKKVPGLVMKALFKDLSHITNRGVLSILVRSITGSIA